MEWNQIILLLTITFLIASLYTEWFRPPISFIAAVSFLLITGVIEKTAVLKSFANEQIAVIMLLLIIGDTIQKTEIIDRLFDRVFSQAQTYMGFIWRMTTYISLTSSVFNNTPLVAMSMPFTFGWARKHKVPASKLLIPLSYAAILGGAATLIGTSTNLLIGGMVEETSTVYINGQVTTIYLESLELFDFGWVGFPMLLIGLLYLWIFGGKLLPSMRTAAERFKESRREYVVEIVVKSESSLIGKTVSEGELRNLQGLYLIEIVRKDKIIAPVGPKEVIEKGDLLLFAGETESIAELIKNRKGLTLPKYTESESAENIGVIEAVVPSNSELIGKLVRESNFREKYDASILAVHRNGEKLSGRIGDIEMKSGDLLLLIGGREVYKRTEGYNNFYILSQVKSLQKLDDRKVYFVLGGVILSILFAALNILPLYSGLVIVLAYMLLSGVLTFGQMKRSTRFNILIISVMALTIGRAMMETGTADLIASGFLSTIEPFGILAFMFAVYALTNILAGYMTNVAAVSIIFPIVLTSAIQMKIDPKPLILLTAFASSANFFTPIGYQTNLMVYSAGNYKFKHFLKIGVPLSILYMVGAVFILYYVFQLNL